MHSWYKSFNSLKPMTWSISKYFFLCSSQLNHHFVLTAWFNANLHKLDTAQGCVEGREEGVLSE